jgi:protein-S-isoprenylcysteine O-methyltransferase Ste14
MLGALVLSGAMMFLSAGTLDWPAGWIFLGLNALTQLVSAAVLIPRQAGLLADRARAQPGTKAWDRFFVMGIMVFGTAGILITAGLDARFEWSLPIHAGIQGAGLVLAFCSQVFVLWAMASNPFFATTVRIQANREHRVASGGPYRWVRHPGYLGSLVYNLAIPLVLGSWWAYLPAGFTILLLFIRTGLEDRTLQEELPGYPGYTTAVRFRLIPGIW